MYLWEVTMRTLDAAGAIGTQTFFVHATTDEAAQVAACEAARGPRQTAHRRGAAIDEAGMTVTWKCAAFDLAARPAG